MATDDKLNAVCEEHARRLYDAINAVRDEINMAWAKHAQDGTLVRFAAWSALINVLADIDAEAM